MARTQTLPPQPITPTSRRRSAGWQSVAWWGVVALPILFFAWVWQRYAVNVPKWDDHALRGFLTAKDQAMTFTGKVLLFFSQHNEHRIVYDRLITALDYGLTGKLNYIHLMVVGNLSLVGLLLVFGLVLRASGRFRHRSALLPLALAPVAWLLFNLSQWENMFWGMAALQNFTVVLWVLAAFYCLSYTNRLIPALVFALLATLTSGNGLLVWPLGLLLLILRSAEPRRSLRSLLVWVAGAAVVVGLYFTGFEKPEGIAYVRPGVFALLKGWLAVVGAAAEAVPMGVPLRNSVLLGGLLVLLSVVGLVWLLFNSRFEPGRPFRRLMPLDRPAPETGLTVLPAFTLFFIGTLLFILGTTAVVAWARTGFGVDLLITSRYKMYSLTLLALLYVYALVALPEQRTVRGMMVAGWVGGLALAWLSYYSFLDETIWWRHWLLTNQFNWTYTTNQPIAQVEPAATRYTDPQPAFYETMLPILFGPNPQSGVPAAEMVTVTKTPTGYVVQNTTVTPLGLVDEGAYLLLRSAKRVYLLPVWQNRASLKQSRFGFGNPLANGFTATLGPGELGGLEAGTYALSVLAVAPNHQPTIYPTNQTITSAGLPIDTSKKNW